MRIPFLDLKRQRSGVWAVAAQRVLDSGWYIHGPELAAFEEAFAAYCGTAACVGTGNGTDALELALRAVGVDAGDEVAAVANAGMYATTAIRAVGAVPLLVDIDPATLLMSPAALAASLGPRTRAVVATHLYGRMAAMPEIQRVAGGIPVIEDCAQAHGAKLVGSAAGAFSFYPTKNLGAAGDAGAVVTGDAEIAGRLRALRQYGWTKRFDSTVAGGRNSRMDEIQAAILRAKLPYLEGWNARRLEIARRYDAIVGRVTPAAYVAHLYVIRCAERDRLREWMAERGVQCEVHYPTPDHLQASQQGLPWRSEGLAATEQAAREVLSLPCYPELMEEEIEFVIGCLSEPGYELQ